MSTLDGPIWSRCSIALTYPAKSHFQRTLRRERRVQDLDERCRSSGEGEKFGVKDRRPILKKLCANLLRSLRGQHGKKMVCARGVHGITEIFGKANSHFDPIQTGQEPHHHFEAAVHMCSLLQYAQSFY